MSMQRTWWTLSGNAVQSYWRTGTVWPAYFWMTHCQERKVCYWFHLNILVWCKRSTIGTNYFTVFCFFLELCSSYRQAGDSLDWNHAVHRTPSCWMPPTCWKRHRKKSKQCPNDITGNSYILQAWVSMSWERSGHLYRNIITSLYCFVNAGGTHCCYLCWAFNMCKKSALVDNVLVFL